MSILIVFLIVRNLTKTLGDHDVFAGITAISGFFIMYPASIETEQGVTLANQFLGAQVFFVAMMLAC